MLQLNQLNKSRDLLLTYPIGNLTENNPDLFQTGKDPRDLGLGGEMSNWISDWNRLWHLLNSGKSQRSNRFEVRFRTEAENGLILWLSRGYSLQADYLALAVVHSHLELSFNLGKQNAFLAVRSMVIISAFFFFFLQWKSFFCLILVFQGQNWSKCRVF